MISLYDPCQSTVIHVRMTPFKIHIERWCFPNVAVHSHINRSTTVVSSGGDLGRMHQSSSPAPVPWVTPHNGASPIATMVCLGSDPGRPSNAPARSPQAPNGPPRRLVNWTYQHASTMIMCSGWSVNIVLALWKTKLEAKKTVSIDKPDINGGFSTQLASFAKE